MWVTVDGSARELVAGDVALFPHGRAHQLASDKYTAPIALSGHSSRTSSSVAAFFPYGTGEAVKLPGYYVGSSPSIGRVVRMWSRDCLSAWQLT